MDAPDTYICEGSTVFKTLDSCSVEKLVDSTGDVNMPSSVNEKKSQHAEILMYNAYLYAEFLNDS